MSESTPAHFDELLDRHRGEVFRVCRSILGDDHLGADAAQETFLRLWNELGRGTSLARAGAWLRRVAVRVSLDHARRRGARPTSELAAEPPSNAALAEPSAAASRDELRRRLALALADLSDRQRTVFLLRHEAGLPLSAVADALGVSLPTAKTQFARAVLRLQNALADERPDRDPR